jgi:hypothetical protein
MPDPTWYELTQQAKRAANQLNEQHTLRQNYLNANPPKRPEASKAAALGRRHMQELSRVVQQMGRAVTDGQYVLHPRFDACTSTSICTSDVVCQATGRASRCHASNALHRAFMAVPDSPNVADVLVVQLQIDVHCSE